MSAPRLLLYFVHPDREASQVNRPLAEAVADLPGLELVDLYAEYPDFRIDREREQNRLRAAAGIIFQFPLFWYGAPALHKQWLDTVFTYGFAFGTGAELGGKELMLVVSCGGPASAYQAGGSNHYTLSELLRPFQNTAHLCGMSYRPIHAIHGTSKLDEAAIAGLAAEYRCLLANWSPS